MKDEIAGGMSNFQNSSVCYLYFFFPANVLCFPHCGQSVLWKEPERPRCPGHSSVGKGLGSAMAQLRAGSQPSTLSWARGWEQPGTGSALPDPHPTPRWCSESCGGARGSGSRAGLGLRHPRGSAVAAGTGRVPACARGSVWSCGAAGAARHPPEFCRRRRLAGGVNQCGAGKGKLPPTELQGSESVRGKDRAGAGAALGAQPWTCDMQQVRCDSCCRPC